MGNKAKRQKPKEGSLWGSKDLSFKPSFYCVALSNSLEVSEPFIDLPIID